MPVIKYSLPHHLVSVGYSVVEVDEETIELRFRGQAVQRYASCVLMPVVCEQAKRDLRRRPIIEAWNVWGGRG